MSEPESKDAAAPKDLDWSNDIGRARRTEPAATPRRVGDLVDRIKELADKLAGDRTSRGDMKILARTLAELRYAFKVFGPYRPTRKVCIFGSARTPPDSPAYEQARQFGRMMAERGWMVVTGGGGGIMEAGHAGAGRENSMGLNIILPFEQAANPVIAGDEKLVHMRYFFTRKLMFVKESDALCLLPGGFGTLDEGFEVLTLLQTGKRDMVPLVMLEEPGGDYWAGFQEFVNRSLLARGMIDPTDLALYRITDSVAEAVDEVAGFFKVYYSMRYVPPLLVFRLTQRISDELLERINEQFASILIKGKFELRGPLPEEKDEPALAALPRLVFQFNRRDCGRLRQLIDCLNRGWVDPTLPQTSRAQTGDPEG